MIDITRKRSHRALVEELTLLGPNAIAELMAEEVKLAFKAGMLHLNVLTNEVKFDGPAGRDYGKWGSIQGLNGEIEVGDFKTLPDLYLQHKGLV
jgi:hypothetical protein